MGVYLKTALAVILIVVIDWLLGQTSWWRMPEGTLEIFFAVFGVVYAIIVGFAMYEALTNYSEIRQCMNSEVNELNDLRDYLIYVGGREEVKQEIRTGVKQYVRFVIEKEWPMMCANQPLDVSTPGELYNLMKSVQQINPDSVNDSLAVDRLITTLSKITTLRTNRITASVEKLPGLLVQLLSIMSLFMITALTLVPIDASALKVLLTAANSFGVAFTYFVILDLDYPFHGVWSIQPKAFEQYLQQE